MPINAYPLTFSKNAFTQTITVNVTKTILKQCAVIDWEKYSLADFFDYKQLKKFQTDRKETQKKLCDDLKVKVILLEQNGVPVTFIERDILGNVLLNRQTSEPQMADYVYETVILQTGKNGKDLFRLNLGALSHELQNIFKFSVTKVLTHCEFDNKFFTETLDITFDSANKQIILKPNHIVSPETLPDDIPHEDIKKMLTVLNDMILKRKQHLASSDKSEGFNEIIFSGQWKKAEDFKDDCIDENCIYFLATEHNDGNPETMYIGEAMVSGNRLTARQVDGVWLIGHAERPADWHIHKFTRYRIDKISTFEAMHEAQDEMIGSFKMADYRDFPNGFKLTNDQFNKAYEKARKIRETSLNKKSQGGT